MAFSIYRFILCGETCGGPLLSKTLDATTLPAFIQMLHEVHVTGHPEFSDHWEVQSFNDRWKRSFIRVMDRDRTILTKAQVDQFYSESENLFDSWQLDFRPQSLNCETFESFYLENLESQLGLSRTEFYQQVVKALVQSLDLHSHFLTKKEVDDLFQRVKEAKSSPPQLFESQIRWVNGAKLGSIKFNRFYQPLGEGPGLTQDLKVAIHNMLRDSSHGVEGIQGLEIDLTENRGGYLGEIVSAASLFVNGGAIIRHIDSPAFQKRGSVTEVG